MDSDSKVYRHRSLLAAYLSGNLMAAAREELGVWLDKDWWDLSAEEQQAVDAMGLADVIGVVDLPVGLGSYMPPRCVVSDVAQVAERQTRMV